MSNSPNENQSSKPVDRPSTESAGSPVANPTMWSPVADAMRHNLPSPMTKQGNPIDPKDPGSTTTRFLAIFMTMLMTILVVGWQNTGDDWKFKTLLGHPAPVVPQSPEHLAPGSFGQVDLVGRFFFRGFEQFQMQSHVVMSQLEVPGALYTDEDRIRIIMITGEFVGDEAALDKVLSFKADALSADFHNEDVHVEQHTNDLVIAELNILETLYTYGLDSLEEEQLNQLRGRYGLIGKVAATHGLDNSDPERHKLIDGFGLLAVFIIFIFFVILIIPLLSLGLLGFGIYRMASGKMKMKGHIPTAGGSIFLETYALFVGGFVVLIVSFFFIADKWPALAGFSMVAQWLLLLLIFWGVVRGMRFKKWCHAIGWNKGEGVLKEIGIGVLTYLASIPIYLLGVIIMVVLLFGRDWLASANGQPPEPVAISNPILEMVATGDLKTILILFALATTWAPIVEEAIFRGALFRHLRGSMHWVFAAIISAFLFAFMHSYGPLMVPPLIALGFMFAFMREWRGSLIPSMTAHFLHNFSLMAFMIFMVQVIKDPM